MTAVRRGDIADSRTATWTNCAPPQPRPGAAAVPVEAPNDCPERPVSTHRARPADIRRPDPRARDREESGPGRRQARPANHSSSSFAAESAPLDGACRSTGALDASLVRQRAWLADTRSRHRVQQARTPPPALRTERGFRFTHASKAGSLGCRRVSWPRSVWWSLR